MWTAARRTILTACSPVCCAQKVLPVARGTLCLPIPMSSCSLHSHPGLLTNATHSFSVCTPSRPVRHPAGIHSSRSLPHRASSPAHRAPGRRTCSRLHRFLEQATSTALPLSHCGFSPPLSKVSPSFCHGSRSFAAAASTKKLAGMSLEELTELTEGTDPEVTDSDSQQDPSLQGEQDQENPTATASAPQERQARQPKSTTSVPLLPVVDYLGMSDSELLKQCEVDTYRASGPGGQHRNKTESAVRLRHTPTGCVSQSTEQRSQHLNRDTALGRLRQAIALKVRRPLDVETYKASVQVLRILPPSSAKQRLPRGVQHVGPKHADFHAGVRELLDVLAATSCSVSDAASLLGVSTAGLSKLITSEKALLQQVNDMRALQGLKPLR